MRYFRKGTKVIYHEKPEYGNFTDGKHLAIVLQSSSKYDNNLIRVINTIHSGLLDFDAHSSEIWVSSSSLNLTCKHLKPENNSIGDLV
jgi:hypothetical protein